jgi:outer membrane protein assembly factor BamB
MRSFGFAVLALSFSVSASLSDDASRDAIGTSTAGMSVNWPHFRFDKKHTGYQPFETTLSKQTIPNAGLLWQADLGGELVFLSSPAVVDGIVYIGEIDGTLLAYDANGCGGQICTAPLWQSSYLAEIVDSPTVANGIVYVGSQTSFDDGSGKLNAFDAKGCGQDVCEPLRQGKAGKYTSYSSPTVWKGHVFIGSADGYLYVFNAAIVGPNPIGMAQMTADERLKELSSILALG